MISSCIIFMLFFIMRAEYFSFYKSTCVFKTKLNFALVWYGGSYSRLKALDKHVLVDHRRFQIVYKFKFFYTFAKLVPSLF